MAAGPPFSYWQSRDSDGITAGALAAGVTAGVSPQESLGNIRAGGGEVGELLALATVIDYGGFLAFPVMHEIVELGRGQRCQPGELVEVAALMLGVDEDWLSAFVGAVLVDDQAIHSDRSGIEEDLPLVLMLELLPDHAGATARASNRDQPGMCV